MPAVNEEVLREHNKYLTQLHNDRDPWFKLWRELSDNYLPQRYRWLMNSKEFRANRARRQYIINNTGTQAARILAAGMMNGITSPARPWFKLRSPGLVLEQERELAVWLEEVERRLLQIMAESNFYNAMAVMYLDLGVFGTSANIIYEDFESVIRCYNPPLGEFYVEQDDRQIVDTFARRMMIKVHQYIRKFPDRRYWSDRVKLATEGPNKNLNLDIEISHIIAPNHSNMVSKRFKYYEMYWETRRDTGAAVALELRGFNEKPGIFARWELSGNDAYGVSPGMDALGDNIELQHLHRNKAEMLEKIHRPPILADVSLQNNPVALMPNGTTFVSNLANNGGARPIFTVDARFDQLTLDKQGIEERIRNSFYNYLFTGISDLPTVRSATEINARESEKLILLGGVLERFESEALDPAIQRVFAIADRAGLLPPLPEKYQSVQLQIQYVSILSIAQRAVGTAPTERWLQIIGGLAEVRPDALDLTNFDKLLTNYARDIGLRESELSSQEEITDIRASRQAQESQEQLVQAAPPVAGAAKTLSETDVGGGANALEQLLSG